MACAPESFQPKFIDQLARLRFTGDVDAVPEGTVLFANEPIVRIVAPLPEAQLVETRLMNLFHFETMIASKAARAVIQAPDKVLVDFGLRRAHAAEAGLLAARAVYLAGMTGTATVLAGSCTACPCSGPWRIPSSRRTTARWRRSRATLAAIPTTSPF